MCPDNPQTECSLYGGSNESNCWDICGPIIYEWVIESNYESDCTTVCGVDEYILERMIFLSEKYPKTFTKILINGIKKILVF